MTSRKSLIVCIVMDMLGVASYSLPFIGEFTDLLWAPVSAVIFYQMFGGTKGKIGAIVNFIEELLPGLDFIPSFTMMWCVNALYSRRTIVPTFKKSSTTSLST